MDLNEARTLVEDERLWPLVRDRFLESGEFKCYPPGDLRRVELLPQETRDGISRWLEALARAPEWRMVLDGEKVKALRADYPEVYPEVFRFEPYFARFDRTGLKDDPEALKLLLKLKFPEAYEICCS